MIDFWYFQFIIAIKLYSLIPFIRERVRAVHLQFFYIRGLSLKPLKSKFFFLQLIAKSSI
jgi:hypothetical protein